MGPIARSLDEYQAFRITPDATNRLAIQFDPARDDTPFITCIEIFDPGGRQPPNMHAYGVEWFYVLHGTATVHCDGEAAPLKPGECVLIPAGGEHFIENTGEGRLYLICLMVPDDSFGDLIRRGEPASLDAVDRAVLSGVAHAG